MPVDEEDEAIRAGLDQHHVLIPADGDRDPTVLDQSDAWCRRITDEGVEREGEPGQRDKEGQPRGEQSPARCAVPPLDPRPTKVCLEIRNDEPIQLAEALT
jgi:hypothetical protein